MTRQAGEFYAVTPGQGEQESFPRTLEGIAGKRGAMARAKHLSVGTSAQQVLLVTGGHAKVIFEYREGRETFRSCAGLIPASGPAPEPPPAKAAEVVELAPRRRVRDRRKVRAAWPGIDLNDPPCNTAG